MVLATPMPAPPSAIDKTLTALKSNRWQPASTTRTGWNLEFLWMLDVGAWSFFIMVAVRKDH
jgi:hypothetical protein